MVEDMMVEWVDMFLSSPATWLATAMVCLGCMLVAYFFLYLPRHKNNKQSRRFPRPDAGLTTPQRQAYVDELLVDRRLRPVYRNLKQSMYWVNESPTKQPLDNRTSFR